MSHDLRDEYPPTEAELERESLDRSEPWDVETSVIFQGHPTSPHEYERLDICKKCGVVAVVPE